MIRRYMVLGRDTHQSDERILGLDNDLQRIHESALRRISQGYADVTVRDTKNQTQWIPVPWREYADDDENFDDLIEPCDPP